MYTIKQASEKLGTTPLTIRNWIKKTNVKVVVLPGRKQLLSEEAVATIKEARAASPRAHGISEGMRTFHAKRTETAQ